MPHWYILRARKPLEAIERCKMLMEAYTAVTSKVVEPFELRTPNEFVTKTEEPDKMPYSKAREFLFHYIFAYADLVQLDDFLHCQEIGDTGLRIVGRRTDENKLTADRISTEEINMFFNACEAYTLNRNHKYVPFFEIEGNDIAEGDQAIIVNGEFAGKNIVIVTPPKGESQMVQAKIDFFGCLGVPITISANDIEVIKHARLSKQVNKFALIDEFFAFFSQDNVIDRIVAKQPTAYDMARALQIKPLITITNNGANHYKDSKRIQYIKCAASLVVNHILNEQEDFQKNRARWISLRKSNEAQKNDDAMMKLLDRIV